MKRKLPLSTSTSFYAPGDNNPNGPVNIDQIQLALQDCIAAIMLQLTGKTTKVVMLGGASVTISGGNYSTTAGWVWYSQDAGFIGELFYLPGIGSTSMGGKSYLNASVSLTDISGADPIYYSDGTQRSPHVNRSIVLTPATSPSAGAYSATTPSLPYGLITTLPDATLWEPLNGPDWIAITGGIGYQNSWGDEGTPYNGGRYRLNNGILELSGAISGGTTNTIAFTLPVGFRPVNDVQVAITCSSTPYPNMAVILSSGAVYINYTASSIAFLDGVRLPLN